MNGLPMHGSSTTKVIYRQEVLKPNLHLHRFLRESAKLTKNCLLLISLPASDTGGSPHTQADDVEVGGQRGREALDRLRNVVGRIESSWRPASAEEGF